MSECVCQGTEQMHKMCNKVSGFNSEACGKIIHGAARALVK